MCVCVCVCVCVFLREKERDSLDFKKMFFRSLDLNIVLLFCFGSSCHYSSFVARATLSEKDWLMTL